MYLTQGLHRAVQQQPDRVMTRFGGRERTFGEVADRVARLAGALPVSGTGKVLKRELRQQYRDR